MVLIFFAAVGFMLGRYLGTARRGFVAMGLLSIAATGLQITLLATTADRSNLTLLPIVGGALVVAGLLLGGLVVAPLQAAMAQSTEVAFANDPRPNYVVFFDKGASQLSSVAGETIRP